MKLCILGSFLWLDSFIGATWLWFRNIGLVYWLSSSPRQHHHTTITTTTSFTTHFTTTLDSSSELSINTNGISKKTKIKLFPPISLCANNESSRKIIKIIEILQKFSVLEHPILKCSILKSNLWCLKPPSFLFVGAILFSWLLSLYFIWSCDIRWYARY